MIESYHGFSLLALFLLVSLTSTTTTIEAASAPTVNVGSISKVEDAQFFHIYYGQSFKVIKNGIDGKSYLLMQMLGLLESLKGITSESVASGCVLRSYANGGLTVINATDTRQLASFSAHFTGDADKVQACNIANFGPLTEKTPLQVKSNYMCLSKSVANQTTRFKPVVAWVQYSQGTWTFAREAHKLQYVMDAGGENIDGTISSNSYSANNTDDMDNFHAILCTVDVVLDETRASDASGYTLSTFMMNINVDDSSCFAFLSNQSLWRYDKRISNSSALDWSDGAIAQPQLVLADLIEIFFPTGNYSTVYFRNIAKDEGITAIGAEMCDRSASTPMEPTIVPCQ
ncbi:hypothetical protein QJS10_CPB11g02225 [Acorus calamus]|uniref:Uncharacterized protein n=1 Tax=Acorus calamus TaxID=4465 RepID=A0AAV9DST2_ACOCL|nr:hypothetical protein QJS10_CPB11g02225 [Acorus calamus]